MKITADEVLAYYNRTEFQHGKESRTKWLQEDSRLGPIAPLGGLPLYNTPKHSFRLSTKYFPNCL